MLFVIAMASQLESVLIPTAIGGGIALILGAVIMITAQGFRSSGR